jgi:hypothetical protein
VDVYKVGHHGSLNATPRASLWARFKKKGSGGPNRLITLLSTEPGHHGKKKNKTEVPRDTLVDELALESTLFSTHTSTLTREDGVAFFEVTIEV